MREKELWIEVMNMIQKSNRRIQIYDGQESVGNIELNTLGINSNSVLGVIVLYTTGICVDNWIRVIGQNCIERKGLLAYNKIKNEENASLLNGLLVVAQDIVGGIFAINREKFSDGLNKVWYFAPDTLEWECLDISYAEFFAWLMQGDIDRFYNSMRWNNWKEECESINFDEVMLIYPFLWSKECDLKKVSKKAVPFSELMEINFECAKNLRFMHGADCSKKD